MSVTLDNRKRRPRTETLHLVPSQFTERHQATQVPEIWPEWSVVDSWHQWWENRSDREIVFILALAAVCVVVGAWIASW